MTHQKRQVDHHGRQRTPRSRARVRVAGRPRPAPWEAEAVQARRAAAAIKLSALGRWKMLEKLREKNKNPPLWHRSRLRHGGAVNVRRA